MKMMNFLFFFHGRLTLGCSVWPWIHINGFPSTRPPSWPPTKANAVRKLHLISIPLPTMPTMTCWGVSIKSKYLCLYSIMSDSKSGKLFMSWKKCVVVFPHRSWESVHANHVSLEKYILWHNQHYWIEKHMGFFLTIILMINWATGDIFAFLFFSKTSCYTVFIGFSFLKYSLSLNDFLMLIAENPVLAKQLTRNV